MVAQWRRFSLSVLDAIAESKGMALVVGRSRRASIGVQPASQGDANQHDEPSPEAVRSSVRIVDSLQQLFPYGSTVVVNDAKVSPETAALPYTICLIPIKANHVSPAPPVSQDEHPESRTPTEPTSSTRRSSGCTEDSASRRTSKPRTTTLARRSTVLRLELSKEVQLVKQNIVTRKPWIDALLVMKIVSVNSLTSSAVASVIAFILSFGYPFQMVSEPSQATRRVARGTVAVCCVLVIAFGSLVVFAFVVAKSSKTARRTRSSLVPVSVRRMTSRLLLKTWLALALAVVVAVGWMEAFSALDAQVSRSAHHAQLFVLFATVFVFALYAARAASRLYLKASTQLHTANLAGSIASDASSLSSTNDANSVDRSCDRISLTSPPQDARKVSASLKSPGKCVEVASSGSWKLRRVDHVFFFAVFNAAFLYLYLSSYISLDGKLKVFLFASFSLSIKITLQELTKHLVLNNTSNGHRQILPPLAIHAAMTIPTVVVDAQIRLVFVQLGAGQSAGATSVSIILCELIFRTVKILRLRHMISFQLAHNTGIRRVMKRVNSKIAANDLARMRAEYSQFLVWKLHVLRLHAAEVYADMHGEYISMGCAIAITVFLGGDPLSLFDLAPGTHCDDNAASTLCSKRHAAMDREQLNAVLSQVVSGLVVDYVASVVEIIHEVPLLETIKGESGQLRSFLRVLLTVLAATHVSAVTLFYLKPV